MAQLVTMDALAEEWSVSVRHIRRLIASGELPAVRVGRGRDAVRIDRAEALKVLEPITPSGKDW